jgi:hypothetical protein
MKKYFAHTLPGKPFADWQPLEQHLKETAEKAKEFASIFSAVYQITEHAIISIIVIT